MDGWKGQKVEGFIRSADFKVSGKAVKNELKEMASFATSFFVT